MKEFFFDTADVPELTRVWNDLKGSVPPNLVAGITTNPGIMTKAGKNTLQEWFAALAALSDCLNEIKGNSLGEIHVQFPNSNGTIDEIEKFVGILADLNIPNPLCLKLPPYTDLLEAVAMAGLDCSVGINVTGLSEAGTILKLDPVFVQYASLIPGRMLQNSLTYVDHLAFAVRNTYLKVITGALRDFDQVSTCFSLGSYPTIGLTTWNLIIQNKEVDKLLGLEYEEVTVPEFMPACDARHTKLSTDFFAEMDGKGQRAYADFKLL